MTRATRLTAVAVLVVSLGATAPVQPRASLDALLPPTADSLLQALDRRITGEPAMQVVRYMDQFWRVAANPGFLASQDHIRERLIAAGFSPTTGAPQTGRANTWFEEFPAGTPGWDHTRGTLSLMWPSGESEVLLSRDQHRVALCINSFPTAPGGVVLPVVDVGDGTRAADYVRKNVAGALVLGDGDVERLWVEAVERRGAAGVVSTASAEYVRTAAAGAPRDETLDILQWGSIPYNPALRSFGFKASARAARRLREAIGQRSVTVKVEIDSQFYRHPNRTLVAEIRGRVTPHERVVLVAHIQEPGANDNASGCGTLVEIAAALSSAIAEGAVPAPARTLTFLWVDEMRGSQRWLADHRAYGSGLRYMFSLDMVGERTARTGGVFRIEKQPDPSAVWPRPSDPFTEWGPSGVRPERLRGSLLNDLHLAVCQRRARRRAWPIATNPYEGGSDHTVFNDAGIPAILNWHFTDRYYHTNLDRPDKVDPAEMANVGIAVATTAMLLVTASAGDAHAIAGLVSHAAHARLDLETEQSRAALSRSTGTGVAEEHAIFEAWKKWYVETLDSVFKLPVTGPDEALRREVDQQTARIRARTLVLR